MKKQKSPILLEMLGLFFGCISMSIGINMFLKPHTIAPGGLNKIVIIQSRDKQRRFFIIIHKSGAA